MRKSGLVLGLFALTLGACKGTDGIGPAVTTTVVVSSRPTQIAVGETALASAIVKDQNGNPLTGKTISWTSLNQGVATVTSNGVIRGVSPGNATIQGTVDGITGSATVSVVAPTPSCLSGPTTVTLVTGEVRVLASSQTDGCIKIAATAGPSSYIVIGASTNAVPDVVSMYAIKSDEGETIPNNTLLTSPTRIAAQLAIASNDQPGQLQVSFEAKLRRTERHDINFAAAQRTYAARAVDSRLRLSTSTAVPNVGDKRTFKVPGQTNSCNSFTTITATARIIGTHGIIYTDDASPAGGFTDADFAAIEGEFDGLIYPTDTDYFGSPLDLDANGHIIILYTPQVNKFTPAGATSFVGGFFFAGDIAPDGCNQSNHAELFYLLAPDPSSPPLFNNVRTTVFVRQVTRGTIAHEFQHMINASERIQSPLTTSLESVWLDEALAHFAEDLNGRVLKGLNDTGNYTYAQLASNMDDYNAFFYQNFNRLKFYLADPGPVAPTSDSASSSLAVRGAGWSLVHYTADHYAPGGDIKSFIRSLIPGPDTGVVNLVSKAGNVPFDTLIAGWMVANYADDAGVSGLPTKYTYKTYNMRDNVRQALQLPTYPLLINQIFGSGYFANDIEVRSASGNYFSFARTAGAPARTIRFLNSTNLSNAASFTGASLIVLRTQ